MSIEITVTKKELLSAIREHCAECVGGKGKLNQCCSNNCRLYRFRFAYTAVPDQMHLFKIGNKEDFLNTILRTAISFGGRPFWWSELRRRAEVVPLSPNWFGASASVLRKNGFKIVGHGKKSEFKCRKGCDRQWQASPFIRN